MTDLPCLCGYQAVSDEELSDHLAEMFAFQDDTALDGQVHAEAASDTRDMGAAGAPGVLACQCGHQAPSIAGLDEHLMAVFTPADRVGRDGARHAHRLRTRV